MILSKHFVLIYSLCFIKLGVAQLCIFVSLCKLLHMKTMRSVCITHTDFRGEFSEKGCILYKDPLFSYEVIFSGRYYYMTISLCLFDTKIKQLI